MADILFWARESDRSFNEERDAQRYMPGDVISLLPTPSDWGERCMTHPRWRILRDRDVSVEDLSELMQPETVSGPLGAVRLLRMRRAHLDLSAPGWPRAFRAWLADDSRAVPIFSRALPLEQLLGLTRVKRPRSPMQVL